MLSSLALCSSIVFILPLRKAEQVWMNNHDFGLKFHIIFCVSFHSTVPKIRHYTRTHIRPHTRISNDSAQRSIRNLVWINKWEITASFLCIVTYQKQVQYVFLQLFQSIIPDRSLYRVLTNESNSKCITPHHKYGSTGRHKSHLTLDA